jgi:hypothetical protein
MATTVQETLDWFDKNQFAEKDEYETDAWWPIKVLLFTFILGAMAGSYMTWKIMSKQKAVATAAAKQSVPKTKSIITQTVCTYTWWTLNPKFKVNCEGLDGAWHA